MSLFKETKHPNCVSDKKIDTELIMKLEARRIINSDKFDPFPTTN